MFSNLFRTTAKFYFSLAMVFGALFSGCVTVKLGAPESKRATDVKFNPPAAPFEKDQRDDVDAAWKSKRNGNVISYLSDCKDPTDPPLEQITAGVLSGLTELKYEVEESTTIQDRAGRRVVALGRVDGVPTGVELVVFKRNNCIYILSYVGVQKTFSENKAEFGGFVREFRAP